MYICLECGCTFDQPFSYTERHGLEHGPYETWTGCPNCAGSYDEAVYCDGCGEFGAASAMHETPGGVFCDDCYYDNRLNEDEEGDDDGD